MHQPYNTIFHDIETSKIEILTRCFAMIQRIQSYKTKKFQIDEHTDAKKLQFDAVNSAKLKF